MWFAPDTKFAIPAKSAEYYKLPADKAKAAINIDPAVALCSSKTTLPIEGSSFQGTPSRAQY